ASGAPAKVHAPYSPRCVRSQSGSPSPKPRKSCLPHASLATRRRPSSTAAPSANRPCGLPTRRISPSNSVANVRARRWTVCPSGTRRLVVGELVDAALVPRVAAEGLGHERLDERRRLLQRVHAAADGDDVRVVVLAAELRGLDRPGQDGADAGDLVRGDLLPVARPADHDA